MAVMLPEVVRCTHRASIESNEPTVFHGGLDRCLQVGEAMRQFIPRRHPLWDSRDAADDDALERPDGAAGRNAPPFEHCHRHHPYADVFGRDVRS